MGSSLGTMISILPCAPVKFGGKVYLAEPGPKPSLGTHKKSNTPNANAAAQETAAPQSNQMGTVPRATAIAPQTALKITANARLITVKAVRTTRALQTGLPLTIWEYTGLAIVANPLSTNSLTEGTKPIYKTPFFDTIRGSAILSLHLRRLPFFP
jgi:hypothetical protein